MVGVCPAQITKTVRNFTTSSVICAGQTPTIMVISVLMNLRTFLEHRKIAPARFAETIDVTGTALKRYLDGERVPRAEILERIAKATDGAVQPNDFFAFAPPTAAAPEATEATA